MVYVFCAFYGECSGLIKRYNLKKRQTDKYYRFDVFENENQPVRIILTGQGSVMAAAAVSGAASFFGIRAEDAIINVGTCAGDYEPGQVFICNKITEEATGRTFYPDMILRSGLLERELVTVPVVIRKSIYEHVSRQAAKQNQGLIQEAGLEQHKYEWKPDLTLEAYINVNTNANMDANANVNTNINKDSHNMALYDMEAAAIYQAANLYVGPHRMGFVKVVSDNGDIEGLTSDFIKKLMTEAVDEISSYVDMFVTDAGNWHNDKLNSGKNNSIQQQHMEHYSLNDNMCRAEESTQFTNQLCKDLHCSKVMENQVRQLIKYLSLEGTDYMTYINRLYDEGRLPAHDKKNGKVCLDEIKRELL